MLGKSANFKNWKKGKIVMLVGLAESSIPVIFEIIKILLRIIISWNKEFYSIA
jgi:hypothetical protein